MTEMDSLVSADLCPKWLQHPGLSQAEARSQKLRFGLPQRGRQELEPSLTSSQSAQVISRKLDQKQNQAQVMALYVERWCPSGLLLTQPSASLRSGNILHSPPGGKLRPQEGKGNSKTPRAGGRQERTRKGQPAAFLERSSFSIPV